MKRNNHHQWYSKKQHFRTFFVVIFLCYIQLFFNNDPKNVFNEKLFKFKFYIFLPI